MVTFLSQFVLVFKAKRVRIVQISLKLSQIGGHFEVLEQHELSFGLQSLGMGKVVQYQSCQL